MNSGEAEAQWYVSSNGQQSGPISRSEMQSLYAQGELRANDFVWRDGFEDWKAAGEILGSPRVPPPPPRAAGIHARPKETVTRTVVEGGSFKFGTFVWIILAVVIPLWPISFPLCLFFAYRSYKKPSMQTVRVIGS